jgi:hypothetical protein
MGYRQAFSARGAAQAWGVDRNAILEAIRTGDLPAYRRGRRRWILFPADVEHWIKSQSVRSTDHARARVQEVLAREGRME